MNCPVCDTWLLLIERKDRLAVGGSSRISQMDRAADAQRERETAASIRQGRVAAILQVKIQSEDFDVFLAHNSQDKPQVEAIAHALMERGIYPWLDKWNLRPGVLFQDEIERVLPKIKAVAVFVGPNGLGPWEQMEVRAALTQFVQRKVPVMPVLLPGAGQPPKLPLFLQEFTWVRFANLTDPAALDALAWGITGKRPDRPF